MSITEILVFLVLIPLYVLPSIIAYRKNHKYRLPILLINLFAGGLWGVGWLAAFIWCFIEPKEEKTSLAGSAEEIGKLFELKEKGVISQEEFERKKKELLA